MLQHPQINPYIFEFGIIRPTWYGMMYVVAFWVGYFLLKRRIVNKPSWNIDLVSDLMTYIMIGVIAGGRIGYVLFYGLQFWRDDWLYPLRIMDGGMSFHGGMLGVIVGMYWFAKRRGKHFFAVADLVSPVVPLGLFFGRIGNFINGELWGRVTDLPWGMVFSGAGPLARHPSQLYQALLEGLLLFVLLWRYAKKDPVEGRLSGAFLLGYGVMRSIAEWFREPDAHLSFIAFDWLTMGQLLSMPMMIYGGYLLLRKHGKGA